MTSLEKGEDAYFREAADSYLNNVNHMMTTPDRDRWNSTDWGLWLNSQGGG